MTTKVFISKGSAASPEQRVFVDAVLDMLKTVGIYPRIMNENEWSYEQPLKAINKIIKECDGAVVIAFTRTQFKKGIEIKKDSYNQLSDIRLPTPWNHIEAAMAYSYGLPLLVIAENGLKPEGLIEDGYDWRIYWTDLNPDVVKSDSFKGFLNSWKDAIVNKKNNKDSIISGNISDPSQLKIGTLLRSMTIPQLWKTAAAIIALLSFVAAGSYRLGADSWPWQSKSPSKTIQQGQPPFDKNN